jgi:hypothetical protein
VASALAALLVAGPLGADVFVLRSGDRITGKPYLRGTKFVRIETLYGKLRIPLADIERIVHDDGSEERLHEPEPAAVRAPEPMPSVRIPLQLDIEGSAFWYAWAPSSPAEVDKTLRLVVTLDGQETVMFTDPVTNPGDLQGALVNSFSFGSGETTVHPGPGVSTVPATVVPGHIRLALELPAELAGDRVLRLVYQRDAGTAAEPDFVEVAGGALVIALAVGRATQVRVSQDAGDMQYSGFLGISKKMKNVDTFRVRLEAVPAESP